ncbi:C40 family peptidase [Actinoplanes regularis]|uniref:C40 family peptidase n=1 Tax=Actinoplanes regularis TaxID=52697 RepID=UPI001A54DAB0|nr:C40 family peptidase [Actinoplanes regularis]GIE89497.1 hypothetical protein Are01nite_59770 [Actinoplanes regularis]
MYARLRPLTLSAAVAAALAALFQPVPALAAPPTGQPAAAGVPDSGSRPTQLGALVLPNTPVNTTTVSTIPGSATNPVLQQIEKGRIAVDELGDQLLMLEADRDLAQTQVTTAQQKVTDAQANLQTAQTDAVTAASQAMQQAAAVPPGALDSGLLGLDQLARLERGERPTDASAINHLESAQIAAQIALDEQTLTADKYTGLVSRYGKLNTQLTTKQTAQAKLEAEHADELAAAEALANAADQALGQQYLNGTNGRGADPNAILALQFALAQRGDPYVWSEEGPDAYDCSGLMYRAYRSTGAGFPLARVSRDQYWQTRNKAVDRYSLLPGDLLFWSYTNSWTGIHHVAMYAGDGMMVEAPRTGLNVRLVPVRWGTLFGATRVYGAVPGGTNDIDLGTPDSEVEPTKTPKPTVTKTTKPPASPSPSKSTKPSTPTTPPSTQPSTPTSTAPTTPSNTPDPTATSKSPDPVETTSETPTGGSTSTSTSSSATVTDSASETATTSKSSVASASSTASSDGN